MNYTLLSAHTLLSVLVEVGCSLRLMIPCWAVKFILVTEAGYDQGLALDHTPARGSDVSGTMGWILPSAALTEIE